MTWYAVVHDEGCKLVAYYFKGPEWTKRSKTPSWERMKATAKRQCGGAGHQQQQTCAGCGAYIGDRLGLIVPLPRMAGLDEWLTAKKLRKAVLRLNRAANQVEGIGSDVLGYC